MARSDQYISAAIVLLILASAAPAAAQGAGPQASAAQPLLVPLSGRTTQTGAVVATQTPVPGPTTGINTLNPAVAVQGPFTGSVAGATRRPLSGPPSVSARDRLTRSARLRRRPRKPTSSRLPPARWC